MYTWKWSWESEGDTCLSAVPGREYASRREAEEEIRDTERLYDQGVMYHQGPSGQPTFRKIFRVVPA